MGVVGPLPGLRCRRSGVRRPRPHAGADPRWLAQPGDRRPPDRRDPVPDPIGQPRPARRDGHAHPRRRRHGHRSITFPPAAQRGRRDHRCLGGVAGRSTPFSHGTARSQTLRSPTQTARPAPRHALGIAERHLGDPLRWPEIWELNRGRPLPDPPGGRFTDEDRIWPGQELLLPPDAVGIPSREHPPPAPPQPHQPQPPKQQPQPPPDHTPPTVPASPSTTSPAQPTPVSPPGSATSPDEGQGREILRIVTGLAGAGLLAVGVIALLTRLRRRQQRARRPGRRIPLPTGTDADVEVALRTTQQPDTAHFLDLALRALTHATRQAGLAAPEVVAVLIMPDQVEVRLDHPSEPPPSPLHQAP